MIRFVKSLFSLFNHIPCKCGSKKTKSVGKCQMEPYGPFCEYEIVCEKCGDSINYWAYGFYQYPITRTEAFCRFLNDKKLYVSGFFLGFLHEFKKDLRIERRDRRDQRDRRS